MNSSRANLNGSVRQTSYLLLSVILIIFSAAGVGALLFLNSQKPVPTVSAPVSPSPAPISTPVSVPTSVESSASTITAAKKPSPSPLVSPSVSSTPSASPSPTVLNFTSDEDKFSVAYQSSRRLYQDTESVGNRYTFYSSSGNIAVHVGSSWSWTYPDRQFTSSLTISTHPTFVYNITTQKIVDFQVGDRYYTIQCVHHNLDALKTECDQFISDFKINN